MAKSVSADVFQSVNYPCLFLLLVMERKEREKCSEKNEKLMTTRCFSPFPKNVSPCKSTQVGRSFCTKSKWIFFFLMCVFLHMCVCVCWPEGMIELHVCCMTVLIWHFWGAKGWILQRHCSIAVKWRGGGFFFCVLVSDSTNQFFASLSSQTTTSYVVGCEQQQHAHTEAHTCWGNEWQVRLLHRAPIDDIIAKLLVTPPVSCSQSRSVCFYCGSFTDVTPAACFLRLFNLLGSTCKPNVFSLEIWLISTARSTMVKFMTFHMHSTDVRMWWRSVLYSINMCSFTLLDLRLQNLPKEGKWKCTVNVAIIQTAGPIKCNC